MSGQTCSHPECCIILFKLSFKEEITSSRLLLHPDTSILSVVWVFPCSWPSHPQAIRFFFLFLSVSDSVKRNRKSWGESEKVGHTVKTRPWWRGQSAWRFLHMLDAFVFPSVKCRHPLSTTQVNKCCVFTQLIIATHQLSFETVPVLKVLPLAQNKVESLRISSFT